MEEAQRKQQVRNNIFLIVCNFVNDFRVNFNLNSDQKQFYLGKGIKETTANVFERAGT